jgi:hypothetical protein
MNVPRRRLVSAVLIAAALIAPTAVARPAGPDPSSSVEPGSVAPIDTPPRSHSMPDTVGGSRTRRCGDLLVASGRLVALPSCTGGWQFLGEHQGRGGRDDLALAALPCTPSCDPGVLAHLGSRARGS